MTDGPTFSIGGTGQVQNPPARKSCPHCRSEQIERLIAIRRERCASCGISWPSRKGKTQ